MGTLKKIECTLTTETVERRRSAGGRRVRECIYSVRHKPDLATRQQIGDKAKAIHTVNYPATLTRGCEIAILGGVMTRRTTGLGTKAGDWALRLGRHTTPESGSAMLALAVLDQACREAYSSDKPVEPSEDPTEFIEDPFVQHLYTCWLGVPDLPLLFRVYTAELCGKQVSLL